MRVERWKSINVGLGVFAFGLPILLGMCSGVLLLVRDRPATGFNALVIVLAPVPLLVWWWYLARDSHQVSVRRVLLPVAATLSVWLLSLQAWLESPGLRVVVAVGVAAVTSEVIRVVRCGSEA